MMTMIKGYQRVSIPEGGCRTKKHGCKIRERSRIFRLCITLQYLTTLRVAQIRMTIPTLLTISFVPDRAHDFFAQNHRTNYRTSTQR